MTFGWFCGFAVTGYRLMLRLRLGQQKYGVGSNYYEFLLVGSVLEAGD